MKSVRMALGPSGESRVEALAVPALGPHAGAAGAQPLQGAARGASFGELGVGTQGSPPAVRMLRFVLAGELVIETDAGTVRLGRGDLALLEPGVAPVAIDAPARARFLDLEVDASWQPAGVVPPMLDRGSQTEHVRRRMYVDGGHAHFAEFDPVVDPSPQAVDDASFLSLPGGVASDWHTEEGISLVVVLAGGFELEVSGHGAAQVFSAGDICLVDDRSGRGHLTRTHGETWFAALALPLDHRWQR